MPNQTQQNLVVAYKVQAAKGTRATGAGGKVLRYSPSAGLRVMRPPVESTEVRHDGQHSLGVLGTKRVPPGAYETQLFVEDLDELLQAVWRSTFTPSFAVTEVEMTSITTGTNTIVAAAGSWLTEGLVEGDFVMLTDHSTPANNSIWLPVLDVTASTITVPDDSLTANAVADAAFTLTVAKSLISGATPVERYFTFDEHNVDIDTSFIFEDVKIASITLSMRPDETVKVTFGLMGLDGEAVEGASAPVLTAPTEGTSKPLVFSGGLLRVGDVDYATITGFDLTMDSGGEVTPVLAADKGADVFLDNARTTGSFTAIRTGAVLFNAHLNSTPVNFLLHLREDTADPKPFIGLFIGNALVDTPDGSFGGTGPLIDNVPWRAGKDTTGGNRAATTVKLCTSAPALA